MTEASSGESFDRSAPAHRSPVSRAISVLLAAATLALLVALVYLSSVPYRGDQFTEFYVLDMGGRAEDYPAKLKPGEVGKVTLVIVNREREPVEYSVEVTVSGQTETRIGPIALAHGAKWQSDISFSLTTSQSDQRVEFLLYRKGESQPYRGPLSLLVNASQRAPPE